MEVLANGFIFHTLSIHDHYGKNFFPVVLGIYDFVFVCVQQKQASDAIRK